MYYCTKLRVLIALCAMALFVACGDDEGTNGNGNESENSGQNGSANGDDNGDEAVGLTLSGTVAGYEDGAFDIEVPGGLFDEMGVGRIEEDGSFEVALFSISEVFDDPSEVLSTASTLFECEVNEETFSDPEVKFRHINAEFRTQSELHIMQPADDGVVEPAATLRLFSPDDYEHDVIWIYVDRDVTIQAQECGDTSTNHPMTNMDMDLQAGWNEVVITIHGEPTDIWHDYETTDRPADVEWQVTEVLL